MVDGIHKSIRVFLPNQSHFSGHSNLINDLPSGYIYLAEAIETKNNPSQGFNGKVVNCKKTSFSQPKPN